MKNLKLTLFSLVVIIALALFLKDRSTITVGYLGPFSGADIHKGTDVQKGLQVAIDEWNKKAGFFSAKLQLKARDTEGQKNNVEKVIDQLIENDKAKILVGEVDDLRSEVAIKYSEKKNIPIVVPFGLGVSLDEKNKNALVTSPHYEDYGSVLAKFLLGELKLDKALVLKREHFDVSEKVGKSFRDNFLKLGGKNLEEMNYKIEDLQREDFYMKVIQKNFQMVVVLAGPQETSSFAKILRKDGFKGLLLGLSMYENVDVRALAGQSIYGTYFLGTFSPFTEEESLKKFNADYAKIHLEAPNALAAFGYDSGLAIRNLISKFQFKYSSEKLNASLNELKSKNLTDLSLMSKVSIYRIDKGEDSKIFPK